MVAGGWYFLLLILKKCHFEFRAALIVSPVVIKDIDKTVLLRAFLNGATDLFAISLTHGAPGVMISHGRRRARCRLTMTCGYLGQSPIRAVRFHSRTEEEATYCRDLSFPRRSSGNTTAVSSPTNGCCVAIADTKRGHRDKWEGWKDCHSTKWSQLEIKAGEEPPSC